MTYTQTYTNTLSYTHKLKNIYIKTNHTHEKRKKYNGNKINCGEKKIYVDMEN